MQHPVKIDLAVVFPIKDGSSAWLMSIKADCLLRAGVITDAERRAVETRASSVVARPQA